MAHPEFGHAADPTGFATDFGNVGPIAGLEAIQWEERFSIHEGIRGWERLLRLNLSFFLPPIRGEVKLRN